MPEGNGAGRPGANGDSVNVTQIDQFLIAPRNVVSNQLSGMSPMSAGLLDNAFQEMGIDVVKRIKRPRATLETMGVGQGQISDIVVANIDPARAQLLGQTAPQLAIEYNRPLDYGGLVGPSSVVRQLAPGVSISPQEIKIRVLDSSERPLAGASVTLTGDSVPVAGQTDPDGAVTLQLYTLGNAPARSLFVTVPSGYWDLYVTQPKLTDDAVNVVHLSSYTETIDGFPQSFQFGWGALRLGLNRVPPQIAGQGVKIAIIDSGADNTHPLLTHIGIGRDLSDIAAVSTWNKDLIGHGTHCAGVIAANATDGSPMRGFAPQAEIHVLKVFPGGRYDSLIQALDYCVDNGIDVVNMSLGGDQPSAMVEQTLVTAVQHGIACIVAAGNSGGPVNYPARSPNTLAVAAVGDLQEVRPNTWDSTTIRPDLAGANGLYSPTFTCYGPEIAVCAPGVAIISSVPSGGFEAESGTSMAAPHITGLAALLLAHHPYFRGPLRERGPARVTALFNMIRQLAVPVALSPERSGAGVPTLQGVVDALLPPGALGGDGANLTPAAAGPVLAGLSWNSAQPGPQQWWTYPQAGYRGPVFIPAGWF